MKRTVLSTLLFLPALGFGQTWQQTYGGLGHDIAYSVTVNSANEYVIAGSSTSFGASDNDNFLIILDTTGNILTEKTYQDTPSNDDNIASIFQTSDGGYIMTGYTNMQPILVKLNGFADVSFARKYWMDGMFGRGRDVLETSSDNFIVVGDYPSFIKFNSAGDTIWTRNYTANSMPIRMFSVDKTSDSNYIAVGSADVSGTGFFELTWVKFDSNGDTLWTRSFSLTGENTSVIGLSTGGIVSASKDPVQGQEPVITKFDNAGNIVWQRVYTDPSGFMEFKKLLAAYDGGFYVAGMTSGQGAGIYDFILIKIDGSGNIEWARTYGSSAIERIYDAAIDNNSNIIMVGSTWGFGAIGQDVYVVKADSVGNSQCNSANATITSTTTSPTSLTGIQESPSSDSVVSISFTSPVITFFDSTLCTSVGFNESEFSINVSIYPNPTSNLLTIESKQSIEKIDLFDLTGKLVATTRKLTIDFSALTSGQYILAIHFTTGQKIEKKIIKNAR